jgi:uncharacterized protein
MAKQTLVTCPHCKKVTVYSTDNPFRPFCSERCKLIDFGAWATESYRIAQEIKDDDDMDGLPLN